jgi:hypothetical protein
MTNCWSLSDGHSLNIIILAYVYQFSQPLVLFGSLLPILSLLLYIWVHFLLQLACNLIIHSPENCTLILVLISLELYTELS